jgi:hypothetical protein
MADAQRRSKEPAGDPFSERLRLIRFRMDREHFRLSDEVRLIPRKLVAILFLLFVVAQFVGQVGLKRAGSPWPELSTTLSSLAVAGVVTGFSIFIGLIILLVAYVNRDAKRREMNSTFWTMLVVALMPAYFVTGFIIYFLLREPLPFKCPQCDATVSARFNYCPECKFNLRPTCPQCAHEVRLSDRYCSYCSYELKGHPLSESLPSSVEAGSTGGGM